MGSTDKRKCGEIWHLPSCSTVFAMVLSGVRNLYSIFHGNCHSGKIKLAKRQHFASNTRTYRAARTNSPKTWGRARNSERRLGRKQKKVWWVEKKNLVRSVKRGTRVVEQRRAQDTFNEMSATLSRVLARRQMVETAIVLGNSLSILY